MGFVDVYRMMMGWWSKPVESGNPGSISGPVIHLRGGNVIHRLDSADRAELKNGK